MLSSHLIEVALLATVSAPAPGVVRGGELTRTGSGLSATMWTLMDMYAVPVSETAAALRKRNFDLSKTHEREHGAGPSS